MMFYGISELLELVSVVQILFSMAFRSLFSILEVH